MGKSRFIWQKFHFYALTWDSATNYTPASDFTKLHNCIRGVHQPTRGGFQIKLAARKKNLSPTPKKSTFHVGIYSPLQCMACTLAERYVIGVFQGFPLVGFNQIANLKIFTAWTTFFSSALLYSVESPSNGTVVELGWETVHGWSGDRSSHHRCAHTVADH